MPTNESVQHVGFLQLPADVRQEVYSYLEELTDILSLARVSQVVNEDVEPFIWSDVLIGGEAPHHYTRTFNSFVDGMHGDFARNSKPNSKRRRAIRSVTFRISYSIINAFASRDKQSVNLPVPPFKHFELENLDCITFETTGFPRQAHNPFTRSDEACALARAISLFVGDVFDELGFHCMRRHFHLDYQGTLLSRSVSWRLRFHMDDVAAFQSSMATKLPASEANDMLPASKANQTSTLTANSNPCTQDVGHCGHRQPSVGELTLMWCTYFSDSTLQMPLKRLSLKEINNRPASYAQILAPLKSHVSTGLEALELSWLNAIRQPGMRGALDGPVLQGNCDFSDFTSLRKLTLDALAGCEISGLPNLVELELHLPHQSLGGSLGAQHERTPWDLCVVLSQMVGEIEHGAANANGKPVSLPSLETLVLKSPDAHLMKPVDKLCTIRLCGILVFCNTFQSNLYDYDY